LFDILLTDEAREQLNGLKIDRGLSKRYKAVKKALQFLATNPRHPGLKTHEFTSLKALRVKKYLRHMLNREPRQLTGFSGTMVRKKPISLLLR